MTSNTQNKSLPSRIQLSHNFIFEFLGIVTAAFIPIAILLLENGVETRIDRLVIINNLLNIKLFFGLFLALTLLAIVKSLTKNPEKLIHKILNLISLALLFLLLLCSCTICVNSISWLNDVPVALSTDSAYTSNPSLDFTVSTNEEIFKIANSGDYSDYKKRARISYIESGSSFKEREMRWEILLNDSDTYKYEGSNDFWVYVSKYYWFLESIDSNNQEIALRGFKNLNAHISDIGAAVDDGVACSYVGSAMLMLKNETADWRAKLWTNLIGTYMATALTDNNIIESTRACWLGSLSQFILKSNLVNENHLELLANALWNSFNSFETQHSSYRAAFYSDVPQYIINFYTALSNSTTANEFYEYIRSQRK